MGLQVWLPLNERLNNQGVSDLKFTNSNATNIVTDSAGKIGSCYKRTAKLTDGRIVSDKTINFDGDITICCWAYVMDCVGDTANGLVTVHSHADNTNVGLTVKQVSSTDYRVCCNTGTGSSRTFYSYYGTTNIKNNWHHLSLTYSKTSKQLKLWVDGNCEYTLNNYTNGSKADYVVLFDWSTTYNSTAYRPACKLNDVRIYDDCLTEEEIKELSKGLVLRYTMGYPYVEGTTNLVTTDDGLSNTCYNGATGKYSYGTNTDMYKTVGTFNNRKSAKVYMGTNGLAAYPYIYFDAFDPAGTVTKTLSFYYYPTIGDVVIPYSYNGAYNWKWTSGEQSGVGNNTSQVVIPVKVNEWNYITVTAWREDTSLTSRGVGYIRLGNTSHTSNTSNYWLFSNVQVEAKDHATGYAGKGGTRTGNIVYDISGNRYNGTANNISLLDGGPEFNKSIKFSGSNSRLISPPESMKGLTTEATLSFWLKLNSWNTSYATYFQAGLGTAPWASYTFGVLRNGSYSNVCFTISNGSTASNNSYLSSDLSLDTWYNLVFVYTTGKCRLYRNGVLDKEYTTSIVPNFSGITSIATGCLPNGSYQTDCEMQDLRIYSTALSADDINKLYKYNRL